MGIMDMFRNTQQTSTAPQPGSQYQDGQQRGNQPAQPTRPGDTMQVQQPDAGNPNPPATNGTADNSPLDAWKDVWHTDPNATPPSDPWSQPILPSDPNKIREAASKMDMMSGINPELMQRVQAGNDPQALMDLINKVSQNTLAMSAQLATASVERAGSVIRERTQSELPSKFRDFQLSELPNNDPVLSHPGAQGMLSMARQQLKMKNPNWTASQIQEGAQKYLSDFASAISRQSSSQEDQRQRQNSSEPDWESFL